VKPILFDADTFLCVRKLSLLRLLYTVPASEGGWIMTEYVARHELSTIFTELVTFIQEGRLHIEAVAVRGTPAAKMFKKLRRKVHKGEAEAISWAASLPVAERPLFMSNDAGARLVRQIVSPDRVAPEVS